MKETLIVIGEHPKFEYYCWNCGQLRLSFKELWTCGNCGSIEILKGGIGTLNKFKLSVQRLNRHLCGLRHTPGP